MKDFRTIGLIYSKNNFKKIEELAENNNVFLMFPSSVFELLDTILKIKPNFLLIDIDSDLTIKAINSLIEYMPSNSQTKLISNENTNVQISGFLDESEYFDFFFDINKEMIVNQNNINQIDSNSVSLLLKNLGFSTKQSGFMYLKDAIVLCLENNGNTKQLKNFIYPQIARKYNRSIMAIKISISRIIENTYCETTKMLWSKILQAKTLEKICPTCKEFIILIVDKMMSENNL